MEQDRFFLLLWRFNAIAIGLAALIVICVGLIVGKMVLREIFADRTAVDIVNVDDTDTAVQNTLSLGDFKHDNTTGLTRFSLRTEQTYDGSLSKKSTYGNTLTFGFLAPATGAVHWLFDQNTQLILNNRRLPGKPASRADCTNTPCQPGVAAYFVVSTDTNGDQRLSRNDEGALWVSDPDGRNPRKLLDDLPSAPEFHWLDSTTYLVSLPNEEGAQTAKLSIVDGTLSQPTAIPIPD